jgi:hypothetical protein
MTRYLIPQDLVDALGGMDAAEAFCRAHASDVDPALREALVDLADAHPGLNVEELSGRLLLAHNVSVGRGALAVILQDAGR